MKIKLFGNMKALRNQRILKLVHAHFGKLLVAMGCMLVVAAATAISAWMIKPVLDDIFVKKDSTMLFILPVLVVVIYIMRGGAYYGQRYLMTYVGESIIKQLRDSLYFHIQDLPISFFQKEKTGVLMARITNDVGIIKAMVSVVVTSALRDSFTILGLIFVIFYRDWQMATFAILILPAAFYPLYIFGKRVRKVSTGCQEAMADINTFLHETIAGNKIVKAFGMEGYEKKRFFSKTSTMFKLEIKSMIAQSISTPVMESLAGVGIAFVIWYGGWRVIQGTSTPGTFFSFMAAVIMLYDPIKKLNGLNNAIQQGIAAADRVFEIIDRESDIKEKENPIEIPDAPHSVTLEDVTFEYDDGVTVLEDINIHVKPGEVLALVGASGGGKTSLVNLIPRFFEISKGVVRVGETDIRDASIVSLRKQIAMVTQEPILFNDSVRNNILYGKRDATDAEIIDAAKAAFAYDFIMSLPEKFETNIGELGGRLSGGEKQRLCIARALIKDAPILILDEATSSLDTEAEQLVQKALENLMKGRTTFVIAHRLSTINSADRIITLVKGRIVEEGRHDELMDMKGVYFKLYEMQFKKIVSKPTSDNKPENGSDSEPDSKLVSNLQKEQ